MVIVYWIENDSGERYGNARYFTATGVPKLYGTRKRAEEIVRTSLAWRTRTHGDTFTVVEGELNESHI